MALQHWNSVDTPEVLCMLMSKLPGNTRDQWNRKVLIIRRQQRREPELEDFIDFFDDETQLANDPLFSREAFFNWDSLHARLNSHYKAWSYKKKKHKKIKVYRKSL